MNTFVSFFLVEQSLRWKVYLFSAGVSFVYAIVNSFALRRPEETVTLETVSLLFALVTMFVLARILRAKVVAVESESHRPGIRFGWKLAVPAMAAIVFLAWVYVAGISMLQAALVESKLHSLTSFFDSVQASNVSEEDLRARYVKTERVINASLKQDIPVDSGILKNTQQAIHHSLGVARLSDGTKQLGEVTAIDLHSFSITREVREGKITPQYAETLNNSSEFRRQAHYVQGSYTGQTWLILAPGGQIGPARDLILDHVNIRGIVPVEALVVSGERPNVVVRSASFENVTQFLDQITWVDMTFEASRIRYTEGAPLRLRNVSFKNCDLSGLHTPPGWGPVSAELEHRIEQADGRPITFVFERAAN
jgi:hypothetical protein